MLPRCLHRCIDDAKEFQYITDCILKDVECSKDPAMKKAQAIVKRMRQRKLYAFVDEFVTCFVRRSGWSACHHLKTPGLTFTAYLWQIHRYKPSRH